MTKGKNNRKKENAEERKQPQAAHVAAPSTGVNPETEAENSAQRTKHTGRKTDDPMRLGEAIKSAFERSSLTDWLLVLFTCVLAAAAIYQFVIMNGQLEAMRKDQRLGSPSPLAIRR